MEAKKLSQDIISRLRSGFSLCSVAQCVNELVYNSLDAKAKNIAVRINLETFRIQVVDDGEGIPAENLQWIGERYMTNKCHTLQEFQRVSKFYGHKGESLSSIHEQAERVIVTTKHSNCDVTYMKKLGGDVERAKDRPSQGTTVTVEDFLYNLPVRRNVVNADLELSLIKNNCEMLSVVHPSVNFSLRNDVDKSMLYASEKRESVEAALLQIHPCLQSQKFGALKLSSELISIIGLVYKELIEFKAQYLYVNKTHVCCNGLSRLVNDELMRSKIYNTREKKRTKFCYLLNLKCAYAEVKFAQHEGSVYAEFTHWERVVRCLQRFIGRFLKREGLDVEEKGVVLRELAVPRVRLSGMGGACKGRVTRDNASVGSLFENGSSCSKALGDDNDHNRRKLIGNYGEEQDNFNEELVGNNANEASGDYGEDQVVNCEGIGDYGKEQVGDDVNEAIGNYGKGQVGNNFNEAFGNHVNKAIGNYGKGPVGNDFNKAFGNDGKELFRNSSKKTIGNYGKEQVGAIGNYGKEQLRSNTNEAISNYSKGQVGNNFNGAIGNYGKELFGNNTNEAIDNLGKGQVGNDSNEAFGNYGKELFRNSSKKTIGNYGKKQVGTIGNYSKEQLRSNANEAIINYGKGQVEAIGSYGKDLVGSYSNEVIGNYGREEIADNSNEAIDHFGHAENNLNKTIKGNYKTNHIGTSNCNQIIKKKRNRGTIGVNSKQVSSSLRIAKSKTINKRSKTNTLLGFKQFSTISNQITFATTAKHRELAKQLIISASNIDKDVFEKLFAGRNSKERKCANDEEILYSNTEVVFKTNEDNSEEEEYSLQFQICNQSIGRRNNDACSFVMDNHAKSVKKHRRSVNKVFKMDFPIEGTKAHPKIDNKTFEMDGLVPHKVSKIREANVFKRPLDVASPTSNLYQYKKPKLMNKPTRNNFHNPRTTEDINKQSKPRTIKAVETISNQNLTFSEDGTLEAISNQNQPRSFQRIGAVEAIGNQTNLRTYRNARTGETITNYTKPRRFRNVDNVEETIDNHNNFRKFGNDGTGEDINNYFKPGTEQTITNQNKPKIFGNVGTGEDITNKNKPRRFGNVGTEEDITNYNKPRIFGNVGILQSITNHNKPRTFRHAGTEEDITNEDKLRIFRNIRTREDLTNHSKPTTFGNIGTVEIITNHNKPRRFRNADTREHKPRIFGNIGTGEDITNHNKPTTFGNIGTIETITNHNKSRRFRHADTGEDNPRIFGNIGTGEDITNHKKLTTLGNIGTVEIITNHNKPRRFRPAISEEDKPGIFGNVRTIEAITNHNKPTTFGNIGTVETITNHNKPRRFRHADTREDKPRIFGNIGTGEDITNHNKPTTFGNIGNVETIANHNKPRRFRDTNTKKSKIGNVGTVEAITNQNKLRTFGIGELITNQNKPRTVEAITNQANMRTLRNIGAGKTFAQPRTLRSNLRMFGNVGTAEVINNQKLGKALILDKFLKSVLRKKQEREERLTSTSVSIKISRKSVSHGTSMISMMSFTQTINMIEEDRFNPFDSSEICGKFDEEFQFVEQFPVDFNFTKPILKKANECGKQLEGGLTFNRNSKEFAPRLRNCNNYYQIKKATRNFNVTKPISKRINERRKELAPWLGTFNHAKDYNNYQKEEAPKRIEEECSFSLDITKPLLKMANEGEEDFNLNRKKYMSKEDLHLNWKKNKPKEDLHLNCKKNKPREDLHLNWKKNKPREDLHLNWKKNKPKEDLHLNWKKNKPKEDFHLNRKEHKPKEFATFNHENVAMLGLGDYHVKTNDYQREKKDFPLDYNFTKPKLVKANARRKTMEELATLNPAKDSIYSHVDHNYYHIEKAAKGRVTEVDVNFIRPILKNGNEGRKKKQADFNFNKNSNVLKPKPKEFAPRLGTLHDDGMNESILKLYHDFNFNSNINVLEHNPKECATRLGTFNGYNDAMLNLDEHQTKNNYQQREKTANNMEEKFNFTLTKPVLKKENERKKKMERRKEFVSFNRAKDSILGLNNYHVSNNYYQIEDASKRIEEKANHFPVEYDFNKHILKKENEKNKEMEEARDFNFTKPILKKKMEEEFNFNGNNDLNEYNNAQIDKALEKINKFPVLNKNQDLVDTFLRDCDRFHAANEAQGVENEFDQNYYEDQGVVNSRTHQFPVINEDQVARNNKYPYFPMTSEAQFRRTSEDQVAISSKHYFPMTNEDQDAITGEQHQFLWRNEDQVVINSKHHYLPMTNEDQDAITGEQHQFLWRNEDQVAINSKHHYFPITNENQDAITGEQHQFLWRNEDQVAINSKHHYFPMTNENQDGITGKQDRFRGNNEDLVTISSKQDYFSMTNKDQERSSIQHHFHLTNKNQDGIPSQHHQFRRIYEDQGAKYSNLNQFSRGNKEDLVTISSKQDHFSMTNKDQEKSSIQHHFHLTNKDQDGIPSQHHQFRRIYEDQGAKYSNLNQFPVMNEDLSDRFPMAIEDQDPEEHATDNEFLERERYPKIYKTSNQDLVGNEGGIYRPMPKNYCEGYNQDQVEIKKYEKYNRDHRKIENFEVDFKSYNPENVHVERKHPEDLKLFRYHEDKVLKQIPKLFRYHEDKVLKPIPKFYQRHHRDPLTTENEILKPNLKNHDLAFEEKENPILHNHAGLEDVLLKNNERYNRDHLDIVGEILKPTLKKYQRCHRDLVAFEEEEEKPNKHKRTNREYGGFVDVPKNYRETNDRINYEGYSGGYGIFQEALTKKYERHNREHDERHNRDLEAFEDQILNAYPKNYDEHNRDHGAFEGTFSRNRERDYEDGIPKKYETHNRAYNEINYIRDQEGRTKNYKGRNRDHGDFEDINITAEYNENHGYLGFSDTVEHIFNESSYKSHNYTAKELNKYNQEEDRIEQSREVYEENGYKYNSENTNYEQLREICEENGYDYNPENTNYEQVREICEENGYKYNQENTNYESTANNFAYREINLGEANKHEEKCTRNFNSGVELNLNEELMKNKKNKELFLEKKKSRNDTRLKIKELFPKKKKSRNDSKLKLFPENKKLRIEARIKTKELFPQNNKSRKLKDVCAIEVDLEKSSITSTNNLNKENVCSLKSMKDLQMKRVESSWRMKNDSKRETGSNQELKINNVEPVCETTATSTRTNEELKISNEDNSLKPVYDVKEEAGLNEELKINNNKIYDFKKAFNKLNEELKKNNADLKKDPRKFNEEFMKNSADLKDETRKLNEEFKKYSADLKDETRKLNEELKNNNADLKDDTRKLNEVLKISDAENSLKPIVNLKEENGEPFAKSNEANKQLKYKKCPVNIKNRVTPDDIKRERKIGNYVFRKNRKQSKTNDNLKNPTLPHNVNLKKRERNKIEKSKHLECLTKSKREKNGTIDNLNRREYKKTNESLGKNERLAILNKYTRERNEANGKHSKTNEVLGRHKRMETFIEPRKSINVLSNIVLNPRGSTNENKPAKIYCAEKEGVNNEDYIDKPAIMNYTERKCDGKLANIFNNKSYVDKPAKMNFKSRKIIDDKLAEINYTKKNIVDNKITYDKLAKFNYKQRKIGNNENNENTERHIFNNINYDDKLAQMNYIEKQNIDNPIKYNYTEIKIVNNENKLDKLENINYMDSVNNITAKIMNVNNKQNDYKKEFLNSEKFSELKGSKLKNKCAESKELSLKRLGEEETHEKIIEERRNTSKNFNRNINEEVARVDKDEKHEEGGRSTSIYFQTSNGRRNEEAQCLEEEEEEEKHQKVLEEKNTFETSTGRKNEEIKRLEKEDKKGEILEKRNTSINFKTSNGKSNKEVQRLEEDENHEKGRKSTSIYFKTSNGRNNEEVIRLEDEEKQEETLEEKNTSIYFKTSNGRRNKEVQRLEEDENQYINTSIYYKTRNGRKNDEVIHLEDEEKQEEILKERNTSIYFKTSNRGRNYGVTRLKDKEIHEKILEEKNTPIYFETRLKTKESFENNGRTNEEIKHMEEEEKQEKNFSTSKGSSNTKLKRLDEDKKHDKILDSIYFKRSNEGRNKKVKRLGKEEILVKDKKSSIYFKRRNDEVTRLNEDKKIFGREGNTSISLETNDKVVLNKYQEVNDDEKLIRIQNVEKKKNHKNEEMYESTLKSAGSSKDKKISYEASPLLFDSPCNLSPLRATTSLFNFCSTTPCNNLSTQDIQFNLSINAQEIFPTCISKETNIFNTSARVINVENRESSFETSKFFSKSFLDTFEKFPSKKSSLDLTANNFNKSINFENNTEPDFSISVRKKHSSDQPENNCIKSINFDKNTEQVKIFENQSSDLPENKCKKLLNFENNTEPDYTLKVFKNQSFSICPENNCKKSMNLKNSSQPEMFKKHSTNATESKSKISMNFEKNTELKIIENQFKKSINFENNSERDFSLNIFEKKSTDLPEINLNNFENNTEPDFLSELFKHLSSNSSKDNSKKPINLENNKDPDFLSELFKNLSSNPSENNSKKSINFESNTEPDYSLKLQDKRSSDLSGNKMKKSIHFESNTEPDYSLKLHDKRSSGLSGNKLKKSIHFESNTETEYSLKLHEKQFSVISGNNLEKSLHFESNTEPDVSLKLHEKQSSDLSGNNLKKSIHFGNNTQQDFLLKAKKNKIYFNNNTQEGFPLKPKKNNLTIQFEKNTQQSFPLNPKNNLTKGGRSQQNNHAGFSLQAQKQLKTEDVSANQSAHELNKEWKSDKSTGDLIISLSQKEKRELLLKEFEATNNKNATVLSFDEDELTFRTSESIVEKDNILSQGLLKKFDCIVSKELKGNEYESIDLLLDEAINEIGANEECTKDAFIEEKENRDTNDVVESTIVGNIAASEDLQNGENDWWEKRDSYGKSYLFNKRTGATMYVDLKESKFSVAERCEFVPKGQSPILMIAEPSAVSMTSSGKVKLYTALAESYKEELGLIKWNKIIRNKDPRKFFDDVYKYLPKSSSIPIISLRDNKVVLKKSPHFIGDVTFSKDVFEQVKVIGQLDNKFIVTATEASTLILFDQHAVHERIRVERLYLDYALKETTISEQSQFKYKTLQQKLEIAVGDVADSKIILTKFMNVFNRFGLKYTINKDKIVVSTVPLCLYNKSKRDKSPEKLKELVMALIEELIDVIKDTKGSSKAIPKVIQNVVNSEACRGAIMFGDRLEKAKCVELVQELKKCNFPFQCAHGRPTIAPIMNMTIEEPKVCPINLGRIC